MKTLIVASCACLLFVCSAGAQESFTAHGSTVNYARPDPAGWDLVNDGMHGQSGGYLLMFKHKPITDAEGRPIEPIIGLISESVTEPMDIIQYSIWKRTHTPFKVNRLLTWQDGSFTYRNSVGFEGEYKRGSVVHKVIIGHLRHGTAGLQVICDSTDGVYDKVEADMKAFLQSITFKD